MITLAVIFALLVIIAVIALFCGGSIIFMAIDLAVAIAVFITILKTLL